MVGFFRTKCSQCTLTCKSQAKTFLLIQWVSYFRKDSGIKRSQTSHVHPGCWLVWTLDCVSGQRKKSNISRGWFMSHKGCCQRRPWTSLRKSQTLSWCLTQNECLIFKGLEIHSSAQRTWLSRVWTEMEWISLLLHTDHLTKWIPDLLLGPIYWCFICT